LIIYDHFVYKAFLNIIIVIIDYLGESEMKKEIVEALIGQRKRFEDEIEEKRQKLRDAGEKESKELDKKIKEFDARVSGLNIKINNLRDSTRENGSFSPYDNF
jgi:predicted RNase H-like nuclease (RuvC/YqgF family)